MTRRVVVIATSSAPVTSQPGNLITTCIFTTLTADQFAVVFIFIKIACKCNVWKQTAQSIILCINNFSRRQITIFMPKLLNTTSTRRVFIGNVQSCVLISSLGEISVINYYVIIVWKISLILSLLGKWMRRWPAAMLENGIGNGDHTLVSVCTFSCE